MGRGDTSWLALGQWEVQPGRARLGTHLLRRGLDSWQVRRDLSYLQFSTVRRILCAPLTLCVLGRFSRFPSTRLLCEVRPLHSYDPDLQLRMRIPGVSCPRTSQLKDQTDPSSSMTKAVNATLSKDSGRFSRCFEQLLFKVPGTQRNVRLGLSP